MQRADEVASGVLLLVLSPTGSTSVNVPPRGKITIGRAEGCELRVDDAKLSRRHAELRASGGEFEVVDLDSRNGTIVKDERIPPNVGVRIGVGDSISIGNTVLVLQRAARSGDRPRNVWTHGYFEARLEEECARSAHEASPFAVVRLHVRAETEATAETQQDGAAVTGLAWWLRDTDIVAKYAPNDYEILLLHTSAEEADRRAKALTKKLEANGTHFDLAVAAYPRDGRTPEALIEHTNARLRREPRDAPVPVVASGALERMARVVERVAASLINVLILGETGVGKEVLARRIHELSPRKAMPLVSINCAALTETLLESELFGYEKGAFTGAAQAKPGLLETANGGTVFLDEVAEMPAATQAKLLRVLEQREVMRVGAVRPRPIDVRLLAATNRDLEREVAEGRFRNDLYFRLVGITLSLPPLRERVDEIEPLANVFIEQACRAMGRARASRLSPDALEVLRVYQWPGNIRELKNVIERAVLLCSGEVITKDHLPVEKMGPVFALRAPAVPRIVAPTPPPAAVWEGTAQGSEERGRIVEALEKCAWNQSQAAKLLGISRGTLIKRIDEFGLPRPRKPS